MPVGAAAALLDGAQDPGAVARNREDRMRQKMQRERALRQREADRIDQKRHVVVDHLDDGVRRGVAVLGQRRIEDAHQGAAAAPPRELEDATAPPRRARRDRAWPDPRRRRWRSTPAGSACDPCRARDFGRLGRRRARRRRLSFGTVRWLVWRMVVSSTLIRTLEIGDDGGQKSARLAAGDAAMIETQRQRHAPMRHDGARDAPPHPAAPCPHRGSRPREAPPAGCRSAPRAYRNSTASR